MTSNTEDITNFITNNEVTTDEQCKRTASAENNIFLHIFTSTPAEEIIIIIANTNLYYFFAIIFAFFNLFFGFFHPVQDLFFKLPLPLIKSVVFNIYPYFIRLEDDDVIKQRYHSLRTVIEKRSRSGKTTGLWQILLLFAYAKRNILFPEDKGKLNPSQWI